MWSKRKYAMRKCEYATTLRDFKQQVTTQSHKDKFAAMLAFASASFARCRALTIAFALL